MPSAQLPTVPQVLHFLLSHFIKQYLVFLKSLSSVHLKALCKGSQHRAKETTSSRIKNSVQIFSRSTVHCSLDHTQDLLCHPTHTSESIHRLPHILAPTPTKMQNEQTLQSVLLLAKICPSKLICSSQLQQEVACRLVPLLSHLTSSFREKLFSLPTSQISERRPSCMRVS